MSAYVVSHATINAILAFAVAHKAYFYTAGIRGQYASAHGIAEQAGNIILAENVRAVNHRYSEAEAAESLRYNPRVPVPRPVEALKLIGCVEYQLAEPDDHKRTEAWELLQAVKDAAIRVLPGYEEAPRELPDGGR